MNGARLRFAAAALVVAAVAACSGGAQPSTGPGAGGGGGGGSGGTGGGGGSSQAVEPTAAGGGGGQTGDIGKIDSCGLLTPQEIEQQLGAPMKDGQRDRLSGDASGCTWDAQQEAAGVSVTLSITRFDQDLWNGETSVPGSEAVPGVGDAAVRGFVGPGVLLIKKGGLEIDLLLVAVFLPVDKLKAAQVPLATKLLSRI